MFSRDAKHYRATPRTVQDAFGPYHQYRINVCRKHEKLIAFVGVLVAGVLLGLVMGWRG